MAFLAMGHDFLPKLCKALGIEGPVRRVVIDAHVEQVITVYVEQYLDVSDGKGDALLSALAEGDAPIVVMCERVDVEGSLIGPSGNHDLGADIGYWPTSDVPTGRRCCCTLRTAWEDVTMASDSAAGFVRYYCKHCGEIWKEPKP